MSYQESVSTEPRPASAGLKTYRTPKYQKPRPYSPPHSPKARVCPNLLRAKYGFPSNKYIHQFIYKPSATVEEKYRSSAPKAYCYTLDPSPSTTRTGSVATCRKYNRTPSASKTPNSVEWCKNKEKNECYCGQKIEIPANRAVQTRNGQVVRCDACCKDDNDVITPQK